MATPAQVAAFNHEMLQEWGLSPGQFTIVAGPTSVYNCIASAIVANGVAPRKLTPPTMAKMDEQYALAGYYPVSIDGAPMIGDAEAYTRPSAPGVPVHAHRVISATTCRSKYGEDCLVEHPRLAFTRARANNSYVYGTLTRRYRYNAAQLAKDQEKIYVTRSGRSVKRKDLDTTTTGTLLPKTDVVTTKTGTKKRKTNSGEATKTSKAATSSARAAPVAASSTKKVATTATTAAKKVVPTTATGSKTVKTSKKL
ncbi:hypothetical protein C8A00DRAFT_36890 [Chaetomidium leptoderma]|uniref:DUF7689 domain-containing protein n=1 Tax=Chaetomidium leptoderma TaxID=669021 RepID=A0AAN6VFW5_9PEZI|nr:hypothetical protein C8A00DRAFT_36890 [Chaetomidium leptoderma]